MRRSVRLAMVACLALVSTAGVVPSAAAPTARTAAASSSATTVSKTVQRTFLDDGKTTVVDKRNVSLTVDVTTKLQSLQLINVSWSGAHPTGALFPDQNSDKAQSEEYPFALFECRGDDTAAHPLSPETCWTQYSTERFTYGSDDPPYPAWRADSAATPAQRAAVVNGPAKLNAACKAVLTSDVTVQRWVPFKGADGTVYPGGPNGCAGQPPEAAPLNLASTVALPSNETFGVTDAQGDGSAAFNVFTNEDHTSLGCSDTVACSLVAVPIMGLSCDPSGSTLPADQRPDADGASVAKDACEAGPLYKPGQPLTQGRASQPAVNGSLWWSPSNWANRIAVPLKFAPAGNVCPLDSTDNSVNVFGSELMARATQSWEPTFCLDKNLFDFKHVQTPEPLARRLLGGGSVEAAFGSSPPDIPYAKPTVQAPVAVSGFGIGYTMDDKNGSEIKGLKLDARLIAKLITSSYPDIVPVKQEGHPGLMNNPYNITQDPEFQALNPDVPVRNVGTDGAASLLSLNTDTDVLDALTAYVAADPEARAWLNGAPDPWGMTVNPSYKNIALPTSSLPLLDDYIPQHFYDSGNIPCLLGSKVPYLQYVAAPTAHLFSIAQDLEFALVQSQTMCVQPSGTTGDNTGNKMVAAGRQDSGNHAMFGLVGLADAARSGVQVATLETYTSPEAATKFTSTAGRSFAAPDQAGLRAAATTFKADTTAGVWPVPYTSLRSSAHADAYPGTMVIYADVPTSGLAKGDGAKYSKLLTYAAGDGQKPGIERGQLPPGYLPMTSGNGLGSFVAYTRRAAKAVDEQQGYLPSLIHADPPKTTPTTSPTTTTGTTDPGSIPNGGSNGGTGPISGGGSQPTTPVGGSAAPVTKGGTKTSPAAGSGSTSPAPALAAVRTPSVGSGIGGWALPVLLLLAIAALGGGLVTRLGSRAR